VVEESAKVFISYSWDSDIHRKEVLRIANTLRERWGINAEIDEYVRSEPPYTPEQGWDRWMHQKIEWADYVLVVCTEAYKRRFEGNEEPGEGLGVSWEGTIIMQELYQAQSKSTKFIPVVLSASNLANVPAVLNSKDKYILGERESFKQLCYRLKNQGSIRKPRIGRVQLEPPSDPETFTSYSQDRASRESYRSEATANSQQSRPQDMSAFARQRLEQSQGSLHAEWSRRNEKLTKLREGLAIQADVSVKFQLESQIKDEETRLAQLDKELNEIENSLRNNR
jgi:SEFIR domain